MWIEDKHLLKTYRTVGASPKVIDWVWVNLTLTGVTGVTPERTS